MSVEIIRIYGTSWCLILYALGNALIEVAFRLSGVISKRTNKGVPLSNRSIEENEEFLR